MLRFWVFMGVAVLAGTTSSPAAAGVVEDAPAAASQEKPAEPAARQDKAQGKAGYKGGFWVQSEDESFKLRVGGYAQLDGRSYSSDSSKLGVDTFILRRARPTVQGTLAKCVDFYINPDFGGGTTVLQDAYLDAHYTPRLRVRAGKMKTPFGLERLQSASSLLFVERAFPTAIAPNRDLGVQLHGELAGGLAVYAAGVFNGVGDGASADRDIGDSKDVAGRLWFRPFKNSSSKAVKGFGLGIAATTGKDEGALASYRTPGQLVFFSYASDAVATGTRRRFSPQAYHYAGPLGLLAEYARSAQEIRRGTAQAKLQMSAWQVSASFVLSGEGASYGGVKPKKAFEPGKAWGAWELAARVEGLDADEDAFTRGFADRLKSASEARSFALGLNWYLNENLKFVANFARTTFKGGAATGDRSNESAILFRTQVAF